MGLRAQHPVHGQLKGTDIENTTQNVCRTNISNTLKKNEGTVTVGDVRSQKLIQRGRMKNKRTTLVSVKIALETLRDVHT